MSVGLDYPPVSKKKPGRPKAEIDTEPVRIRSDILRKARWIALSKQTTIGQLLSDMLEPMVNREYDRVEKPR